jgi:hypothetical protein
MVYNKISEIFYINNNMISHNIQIKVNLIYIIRIIKSYRKYQKFIHYSKKLLGATLWKQNFLKNSISF